MRIRHTTNEINLLARLMRAEAVGEGIFGMKLVGNVVVNRVVYTCKPFKKLTLFIKLYIKKINLKASAFLYLMLKLHLKNEK